MTTRTLPVQWVVGGPSFPALKYIERVITINSMKLRRLKRKLALNRSWQGPLQVLNQRTSVLALIEAIWSSSGIKCGWAIEPECLLKWAIMLCVSDPFSVSEYFQHCLMPYNETRNSSAALLGLITARAVGTIHPSDDLILDQWFEKSREVFSGSSFRLHNYAGWNTLHIRRGVATGDFVGLDDEYEAQFSAGDCIDNYSIDEIISFVNGGAIDGDEIDCLLDEDVLPTKDYSHYIPKRDSRGYLWYDERLPTDHFPFHYRSAADWFPKKMTEFRIRRDHGILSFAYTTVTQRKDQWYCNLVRCGTLQQRVLGKLAKLEEDEQSYLRWLPHETVLELGFLRIVANEDPESFYHATTYVHGFAYAEMTSP